MRASTSSSSQFANSGIRPVDSSNNEPLIDSTDRETLNRMAHKGEKTLVVLIFVSGIWPGGDRRRVFSGFLSTIRYAEIQEKLLRLLRDSIQEMFPGTETGTETVVRTE